MLTGFQVNDPSLESQWRAIILFGKNSATYKFAFAQSLLELADSQTGRIKLEDLATPFSGHILNHLKANDKQGNSSSSKFLNGCRSYLNGQITESQLHDLTVRYGFVNVVDAFQNVNGGQIMDPFYQKDYSNGKKEIVITDNLLSLKEEFQFRNFSQEVEARWKLVETAWNLNLNPKLLEVKYDELESLFFVQSNEMRRINISSVRDSLNGYQKGRCFYSDRSITINIDDKINCAVDHFLPHINKMHHAAIGGNINGVWNLVLAAERINLQKNARVPSEEYLIKLFNRNEHYIESKHPLAETIINQTGDTRQKRQEFLKKHYQLSLSLSIHKWDPKTIG